MNAYLSNKLKILSFLSILGLMVTHSHFLENESWTLNNYIQTLLGGNLLRFRIPLFFMISGYLFFYSLPEGNIKDIYPKIRKRYKSLFLPFIYWNIIFYLIMVTLKILPTINGYINTDFLSRTLDGNVYSIFKMLFLEPAGFHLWFLQYLIFWVMLSPLIYIGIKYIPIIFTSLILLMIGFNPYLHEYFQSIIFFVLGGLLSYKRLNIDTRNINSLWTLLFMSIFVILCVLNTFNFVIFPDHIRWIQYSIGIIGMWLFYDYIMKERPLESYLRLAALSSYNFFFYAFHEPFLNIFKKIIPMIFGSDQYAFLIGYILSPIFMIIVCFITANMNKKFAPKLYSALTGGRGNN